MSGENTDLSATAQWLLALRRLSFHEPEIVPALHDATLRALQEGLITDDEALQLVDLPRPKDSLKKR